LIKAIEPEAQALIGKQASKEPLFSLQTDNCQGDFEVLRAQGVMFIQEPKKEDWRTAALFQDSHGNLLYMVQP
jgi:hypothetical protein